MRHGVSPRLGSRCLSMASLLHLLLQRSCRQESKTVGTPIRRARICPAGWRPWDPADLPFVGTPPDFFDPAAELVCRAAAQPVAVAANGRRSPPRSVSGPPDCWGHQGCDGAVEVASVNVPGDTGDCRTARLLPECPVSPAGRERAVDRVSGYPQWVRAEGRACDVQVSRQSAVAWMIGDFPVSRWTSPSNAVIQATT
jgi:hypothetical protein